MYSAISDPWLRTAFLVGCLAVVLSLTLSFAIIGLRLRLRARERRWQRFVGRWRPALLGAILDPAQAPPLPQLRAGQHVLFLRLWAYLHESVRGDAARLLNDTAIRLRLDETARRLLVRGSRAEKLQATLAVGYLRDIAAWDALIAIARSPDSLLSVNAARALVRINPLRAANGLMPLLVLRTDWDLSRVAALLTEARPAFWLLLSKVIPRLKPHELPRALLLAEALRLQLPDATLARLLQDGQPAEVVQAALRLSDSLGLGDHVRACLSHPDAAVREQAALRMARVGTRDDVPALTALLDDTEWLVRMAAARSLGSFSSIDDDALEELAVRHAAAAPMLRQVRAERALA